MTRTCSERLRQVQTPIIPYIASIIRETPGTLSLGQGVVGYGPPPEAIARISEFLSDPENHKYRAVQGIPALVEALAAKLRTENKIEAPPNRVFVTAGGNLAFTNALLAITNPGDELILQVPYYFNHEMAITMASCQPVLVPTADNYQLQPDLIRRAITSRTKAVVTISPNNPTGAVYPEETLREVNALCRDHGIYHIHDEAYEYFTFDGATHFSPGSIPGADTYTISLYSLSKAYGFASWRIGYMVLPEHLTEAVNKIQDTILICAPVISQYAALGALAAGRSYCAERLEGIKEVRDLAFSKLRTVADLCEVPKTDGAFYFLIRLKHPHDPLQVAEQLIRKHKIATIPGTAFGLMNKCCLRVAYGSVGAETVLSALDRFTRGVRELER